MKQIGFYFGAVVESLFYSKPLMALKRSRFACLKPSSLGITTSVGTSGSLCEPSTRSTDRDWQG